MTSPKIKKTVIWIIKIVLSIIALWFVYRKINWIELQELLSKISIIWIILAIIVFNISKIFQSFRLKILLKDIGIETTTIEVIKLNYTSSFYSILLPGGISGDFYKGYLLNIEKKDWKVIAKTLLYDRISGLFVLLLMAGFLAIKTIQDSRFILTIICIIALPTFIIFTKYIFKIHANSLGKTTIQSILVQLTQIGSMICLLFAFRIEILEFINYVLLFLASSIASVIPITFGGAGSRELVFSYGEKFIHINKEVGVALASIFFFINLISNLIGVFFRPKIG